MSTLHTLALEYIVAVYPLLLTLVIYVCIEMYDRGIRVVVCVWRPFHVCFTRFRRRWNPKGFCSQNICFFPSAVIFKAADGLLQATGY